jgi:glycerate-2-kinase
MPANQEPGARARLVRIYRAAVAAVEAGVLVRGRLIRGSPVRVRLGARRHLRLDARRVWLIAAGKAAAAMARAASPAFGSRLAGGIVAAPLPARGLDPRLRAFVSGHPTPTRASLAAGRATWRLLGRARRGDLVLVLLSGGASSLLVLPGPGIRLCDKVRAGEALLRAGATIGEINAVRKHLSLLKGGGIVRRADGARVLGLLLSDVIGSSPSVIGSGPSAPDPTRYADAWRVLERHGLLERIPRRVVRHLALGRRGAIADTLKPGDRRVRNLVIGDNRLALSAAAAQARSLGLRCEVLTSSLHGDTRAAARWFASHLRRRKRRFGDGLCLLAGGETTVVVRGSGRGGRNLEFALALAEELRGLPGVHCLSAGSDGRDGPTDAAGAFVDGSTFDRAMRRGLDPRRFLERNDSYGFFHRLGGLFRPGPTGTNVMDLKIAIVDRGSPIIRRGDGRS